MRYPRIYAARRNISQKAAWLSFGGSKSVAQRAKKDTKAARRIEIPIGQHRRHVRCRDPERDTKLPIIDRSRSGKFSDRRGAQHALGAGQHSCTVVHSRTAVRSRRGGHIHITADAPVRDVARGPAHLPVPAAVCRSEQSESRERTAEYGHNPARGRAISATRFGGGRE